MVSRSGWLAEASTDSLLQARSLFVGYPRLGTILGIFLQLRWVVIFRGAWEPVKVHAPPARVGAVPVNYVDGKGRGGI